MMFEFLLLYELLTTDTTELTFTSKIIVNVIDKGKVVALLQKNKIIDIDTLSINLKMVNVWCSDFSAEVISNVITPNGFGVWCRVSKTDCYCETAKKVSAEFPPLASCLVIEGTVTAEFRLKADEMKCMKVLSLSNCIVIEEMFAAELELRADEMKCMKVLSLSSCIVIEGMLTAGFESRAGAEDGCEIPSFGGWVMPWTMDVAGTRFGANKTDDSELIEDIKGITDVFILCLICLWACSLSSIWSIASRQAVVTSLKWINNMLCSILPIITCQRQWWCSQSGSS